MRPGVTFRAVPSLLLSVNQTWLLAFEKLVPSPWSLGMGHEKLEQLILFAT